MTLHDLIFLSLWLNVVFLLFQVARLDLRVRTLEGRHKPRKYITKEEFYSDVLASAKEGDAGHA